MECQLHSSNPQIRSKIHTNRPKISPIFPSLVHSKFKTQKIIILSLPSQDRNQTQPISATAVTTPRKVAETDLCSSVKFKTGGNCRLGISRYPDFQYNAEGGTGTGTVRRNFDEDSSGEVSVSFDMETLYIPPLTSATTKFLGMPLPPFLRIDIVPELFEGTINKKSGKVDLEFKAKFLFSIGSIYKAAPLVVETLLTSEESKGKLRSGKGKRLLNEEEGNCRLVGVATVDPIDDFLLNSFLSLPTECLAIMNATISFSSA